MKRALQTWGGVSMIILWMYSLTWWLYILEWAVVYMGWYLWTIPYLVFLWMAGVFIAGCAWIEEEIEGKRGRAAVILVGLLILPLIPLVVFLTALVLGLIQLRLGLETKPK